MNELGYISVEIKHTTIIISVLLASVYADLIYNSNTVERLRLRFQISLNLTPVSICLNFRQIVYYV